MAIVLTVPIGLLEVFESTTKLVEVFDASTEDVVGEITAAGVIDDD